MRFFILALLSIASFDSAGQVYRCGTTYQSSPCPGGKVVDTTPATSAGSEGSKTTIYFCKGYKGTNFWSSKHCISRGDSTLDREVSVPSHLSWNDKVSYAAGQRSAAEALRKPAPAAVAAAPVQPDRRFVCDGYRQALDHNASASRAGGTARWMEHLAQERRNIVAQQQAAGCR